jgi:hypothetical protein
VALIGGLDASFNNIEDWKGRGRKQGRLTVGKHTQKKMRISIKLSTDVILMLIKYTGCN